jgi:hypothetical protein
VPGFTLHHNTGGQNINEKLLGFSGALLS